MRTYRNSTVNDFVSGQKDCREGVPSRPDMPESYYIGYEYEYTMAANQDNKTDESRCSSNN